MVKSPDSKKPVQEQASTNAKERPVAVREQVPSDITPSDITRVTSYTKEPLSAELKEMEVKTNPVDVAKIKASIDLTDRASLISFGDQAQEDVASYSDTVLRETMNKDSGDVGDILGNMLIKLKGIDPSSLEHVGFFARLFGGMRARVERFRQDFQNVAEQIDGVVLQLEKKRDGLKRDIVMLDGLYDKNLGHLRQLETYIKAGDQYIKDASKNIIPELEKNVSEASKDSSDAQIAAQQLADVRQAMDRLDRKVHDLKLSRIISIQNMPQIRLIQNSNSVLAEKLQTAVNATIPTWKSQMTIALALHRQEEALKLQKEVTDTTNELLRKNAEQLHQGTIKVEKASQRGIVDIKTLAFANKELVGTINDILRIQEEGRAKRAVAETEMKRIEGELKTALVRTKAPQDEIEKKNS